MECRHGKAACVTFVQGCMLAGRHLKKGGYMAALEYTWQFLNSVSPYIFLVAILVLIALRVGKHAERAAWNRRVRENRRRHPDLVAYEKRGDGSWWSRFSVAQEMMMRERNTLCAMGVSESSVRYPDAWDFYIVRNSTEYKVARMRRVAREADFKDLQTNMKAT